MSAPGDTAQPAADDDGRIVVERVGSILRLGVDRVRKRNAFTPKMLEELARGLTLLEADDDLRCCVIHALGDHFSSGMDMARVAAAQSAGAPQIPLNLVDPFGLREPIGTKPVVVALRGYSYTVSMSLMLASDIVIAAEDCRFGFFEPRHGLMPSLGGVARLIDRAGWGNAMQYLLTAREMDATQALRLNLIQEIVPVGKDTERAMEIAEGIAQLAPLALAAIKTNGRTFLRHGWLASVAEIPALREGLFRSEDAKEAKAAQREKRAPIFRRR